MIARFIVATTIALLAIAVFLIPKTKFNYLVKKQTIPAETKFTAVNKIDNPKPSSSYSQPPQTTARSVAVIDDKSGFILYEKDASLKHLPASTTKLMTALTALEVCTPQESVVIRRVEKNGTQMGLEVGDTITIENLLYGLLIASGNDAAFALAENCAQSYKIFVEKMNQKAAELNLKDTNFENPAGFDNDLQYSTARDLAELARVATANPLISKIVQTKSTVVTDVTGLRTYYLENVNKLLGVVDGVNGVKTGQTDGALEILITKAVRNGNGIIISVLGSKDRFGESQALIDWAYNSYEWQN